VHEVGHFLGLEHPWKNSGDKCIDGDGMPDTPNQLAAVMLNAPRGIEELTTTNGDGQNRLNSRGEIVHWSRYCKREIDVIRNNMQYIPDSYRSRFTPGQINFMAWALQSASTHKDMLRW